MCFAIFISQGYLQALTTIGTPQPTAICVMGPPALFPIQPIITVINKSTSTSPKSSKKTVFKICIVFFQDSTVVYVG